MKTTTIKELQKLNNPIIIDIRNNYNYSASHIPSALNIPESILKEMPAKYLSKKETYYLYCSIGNKSQELSKFLNELGYNCYNIKGGYHEYRTNFRELNIFKK